MRFSTHICFGLALLACCLAGLVTTVAQAQEVTGEFVRVDQAVADIDRLSISLRRLEPGLHVPSEQYALFTVKPWPGQDPVLNAPRGPISPVSDVLGPYYRLGGGFRAKVDRIDYLSRTGDKKAAMNVAPRNDQEFREYIPANTVWELKPWPTQPPPQIDPPLDTGKSTELNTSVDTRIERSVEAKPVNTRIETKIDQKAQ